MKPVKNSLKFCVLTLSLSLSSLVFQGAAKAASPYRLGYTFLNPNPAANDFFGISVAGVGNNVLIGAFQDDTNALDAGAAYLFDGNPTSPTFGQLLMTFQSPNPAVSGNFGGSVASVGNNVLIGESFRHATLAQGQPGRAYLFDGTPRVPPSALY
uniref:FG-GAP repeat protein n=1 Tax=Desertifilum tharense IPPAS B-1220 TaxID=1781255 RepID=A0ACD5GS60_9CYAN